MVDHTCSSDLPSRWEVPWDNVDINGEDFFCDMMGVRWSECDHNLLFPDMVDIKNPEVVHVNSLECGHEEDDPNEEDVKPFHDTMYMTSCSNFPSMSMYYSPALNDCFDLSEIDSNDCVDLLCGVVCAICRCRNYGDCKYCINCLSSLDIFISPDVNLSSIKEVETNQIRENQNIKNFCVYTSNVKVNAKINCNRFKLPKCDPMWDKSWCSQKFDFLELAAHFLKLSIDLVSEDTATLWSMMVQRDVKIREKMAGIFLTQNEMIALKKDYEKHNATLRGVSTKSVQDNKKCFSLIVSQVPLPNLVFELSNESKANLSNGMIWKGLLDTGSECSILTSNTVEKSGLVNYIEPCKSSITLTGATGSKRHPFKGEIWVFVKFLCKDYKFGPPIKQKFYVSDLIRQNIFGSDIISGLGGSISYLKNSFTYNFDHRIIHALLVDKSNNLVLKNLDEINIGMNAIRFSCNQLLLCDTMCRVPKTFIPLLGTDCIVLQPGVIKIKDDTVNMNSQTFMIELNSRVKYPKGMFNVEVKGGVIRACGGSSNFSEEALAVGHGQLATASGEVA